MHIKIELNLLTNIQHKIQKNTNSIIIRDVYERRNKEN